MREPEGADATSPGRERLRALVAGLPDAATVTLPKAWFADLLAAWDAERPLGPPPPDLLTVDQAAARLGVTRDYLYRLAKGLPFARKLGHRVLRFEAEGLEAWLAARRRTGQKRTLDSRRGRYANAA